MWRSKAGLIFRRVSRVLNTASTQVRTAARPPQNQVVSARSIRLYSSRLIYSETVLNPTGITALDSQSNDFPQNSENLHSANNLTLESPQTLDPVTKCKQDAENVVSILKQQLDIEEQERELKTLDLNISAQLIATVVKTPGFRTDQFINFFRWAVNQANYVPSSQIMETITMAICSKGELKETKLLKKLMEEITENHEGVITTPTLNIFIRYLGRAGRKGHVHALLKSLCNVEKTPDVVAEILGPIPPRALKCPLEPFYMMIRAFCMSKEIDKAIEFLSQMVKNRPRPSPGMYNTVISALCKADRADQALILLEQMSSGRIRPHINAYNDIMASFAKAGRMQEACDLFSKAKENNIYLHFITYKILIDGFCRLGEPKKALQYFSELTKSGLHPNHKFYPKLLSAYTLQVLDLVAAKKLLDEVENKGISPT